MTSLDFLELRGAVAVLTGAGSGIGAAQIVNLSSVFGIERREWRVLVGKDAVGAMWLQRFFPVTCWKHMGRSIARRIHAAEASEGQPQ